MALSSLLAAVDAGFFINPWKLIPPVVLLLVWAKLASWVDKDSDVAHLPRVPINMGVMSVALVGFALFFLVPNFLVGTLALFLCVVISIGGYIGVRAQRIGTKDLSKQFKDWLSSIGKRKDAEVAEVVEDLQMMDSRGKLVAAPEEEDPDFAGYKAVQELFVDPLKKNAETIQLKPEGDVYRLSFVVDGFPYAGPSPEKGAAEAAITFIKKQAGMDLEEVRKPQKGSIKATTASKKRDIVVNVNGSSAGESLAMLVDPKTRHALRLENLGFTEIQEAAIRDSIEVRQGIVLLSAPKGQGLTSMGYGIIRAHDAFLTHIHTIERNADQDLEGITQNKLPPGAPPAEELKQVGWVASQEPDVLMMTSIEEPQSAKKIIEFAGTGKKAYVAIRAENAVEAINVWRKMVGDDARAMRYLVMSVSGRVVRKLCPACKVGVTPDPEQLKKLNLDPAKVSTLYQERVEPLMDQKGNVIECPVCEELRFKGRTGVFEVVIVDEEVKEAVIAGASNSQLRSIIRKQRIPSLQEAALEQIQKGETSVKEVTRVFAAKAPAK